MSKPIKLPVLLKNEAQDSETYKGRLTDLKKTFRDGRSRFHGLHKTYAPRDENGENRPAESKQVETTVREEVSWFRPFFANAVNSAVRKERTNAHAISHNTTILGLDLGDLPATALLNLEAKLKALKTVVVHTPTLDGAHNWDNHDPERGIVKKTPDEWTHSTEKKPYTMVKAEATDKHPAQVEVLHRDEIVGTWTKRILSGEITTSAKARILAKIDAAVKEVVAAREAANLVDCVDASDVGERLYDEIFKEVNQ